MVKITKCTDCANAQICEYRDAYKGELEILLSLRTKFLNTKIEANCQHNYEEISNG